ncbi:MAG: M28 family peptidase, partial [Planctomycetes bacterium]|nr:M28 family peptidase [Planctomycetota bacterium]
MPLSAVVAACVLAIAPQPQPPDHPELDVAEKFLSDHVSAAETRRHLRRLTEDPHVAGSPAEYENARYVRDRLDEYGFATELVEYRAFLPYPVRVDLALTAPESIEFDLTERPDPRDKDTFDVPIATYNAYSASATVEAPVAYANYGSAEDFDWLESKGVLVEGKIVLIRYGKQFRGLKVREAERRGAAGVLLFSDPADDGYPRGDAHPEGPWRPPSAVQRGSILYLSEMCGDPLTPGRPALPDAERLDPADCAWLPKIPCLPISAENATEILRRIRGPNVPKTWQGACPVTYHLGPGPARARLAVELDDGIRSVRNVIGRLRTESTSDKYVLVGGHRDAWVHGANDPSSGTAIGLEAMRVIGELVRDGFEPRCEIRFASWDGEEFGLVGSTEWCEQFADDIQQNCLAYFNCDSAISGTRFGASATPDLVDFLADVAARTIPHDGRGRLLTRWAHGKDRPPVGNLGSGSDYTAFVCRLGIPSFDFGSRGGHGVYHSRFDTFFTMESFLDPGFVAHEAMARFLAIATYRFANSDVPPIEPSAWIPWLSSALDSLDGAPARVIEHLHDRLAALREAVTGPVDIDALVSLHGAVLHADGVAGRPWFRNVLVAPHIDLGYGAAVLPALSEAVDAGDEARIEHAAAQL